MIIALISGASTIHTVRWANALSEAGHEVHVISQHPIVEKFNDSVHVYIRPYYGNLGYFLIVPFVKRLLKKIKPDVVNAHYASGYGTTARLVGYHPWVMSVWGADVYDFPSKSFIHKHLVRKNLLAADAIASTSHCMAEQTKKLIGMPCDISITPFGVDMKRFQYMDKSFSGSRTKIVIGTVKTMAPKYGIDTLIKAFALVQKELSNTRSFYAGKIQLRLVGGAQIAELKILTEKLGIADSVLFVGKVSHSDVPSELSKMDIYVALSRLDSESFGVAIIEAGAAGLPVVVSNVEGLSEVVLQDVTGKIVSKENPEAAANAILELVRNESLRLSMGKNGNLHVEKNYEWNSCVDKMLDVYSQVLN